MLGEAGFQRMCAAAVRAVVPPLVFSHPPLTPTPAGAVNVHGHLHRHDPPSPEHWNVSVQRIGFRPIRLDRLIAHMAEPSSDASGRCCKRGTDRTSSRS